MCYRTRHSTGPLTSLAGMQWTVYGERSVYQSDWVSVALVEVEPPGAPLAKDMVRLSHGGQCSSWFPWASIGADQISELGLRAGLAVTEVWTDAGRWFAALSRGIDS